MRSLLFLGALCALGCSVGDFPLRADAGATVDVPSDIAAPIDTPAPNDTPAVDAPDVTDNGGCAGAMLSCGGTCVDAATDARNCGRCGHDCTALAHVNGSVACVAGHCATAAACAAGFAHCSAAEDDGCESDLSQPAHCGGCSTACIEPSPLCASVESTVDAGADAAVDASADAGADAGDGGSSARYACRSGCTGSTTRCSMSCVDTQTSLSNCGTCGNTCPAAPSATPTCAAGACGFTCATNFSDCDRSPANGCEVDTRTSLANCGMCGNACPTGSNATPTCVAGACGIVCAGGYADCDGNPANGCEVDTRVSASHCGMCGNACPSGMNSTPVCRSSACSITCSTGFSDCDGMAANGCEVNFRTSVEHCGACGHAYPSGPNATPTCSAGVCGVACRAPYADCDGFIGPLNGCETDVTQTVAHCGMCGNSCPTLPGSTATCTTGTCGYTCTVRYGDCDSVRTNGCETDLYAQGNCGRCGRTCGMSCFMGICIPEG